MCRALGVKICRESRPTSINFFGVSWDPRKKIRWWCHPLTSPVQSNLGRAASQSRISYNGTPQVHPKTAPSLRRWPPHLIHRSIDRPNSPSQTASEYNQPFCHSTLFGQTDRQTDKWDRRQFDSMSRLRLIASDAAKNYLDWFSDFVSIHDVVKPFPYFRSPRKNRPFQQHRAVN